MMGGSCMQTRCCVLGEDRVSRRLSPRSAALCVAGSIRQDKDKTGLERQQPANPDRTCPDSCLGSRISCFCLFRLYLRFAASEVGSLAGAIGRACAPENAAHTSLLPYALLRSPMLRCSPIAPPCSATLSHVLKSPMLLPMHWLAMQNNTYLDCCATR